MCLDSFLNLVKKDIEELKNRVDSVLKEVSFKLSLKYQIKIFFIHNFWLIKMIYK